MWVGELCRFSGLGCLRMNVLGKLESYMVEEVDRFFEDDVFIVDGEG